MTLLSVPNKRIEAVRKGHIVPKNQPDKVGSSIHAFGFMLWGLTWTVLIVEYFLLRILTPTAEIQWIIIFTIACAISILVNNKILWKKDRYKYHFSQLHKRTISVKMVVITIAFHVLPLTLIWVYMMNQIE
jgi:hypothetical protein